VILFSYYRLVRKVLFLIVNFLLCGVAKACIYKVPLAYLSKYFGKFQPSVLSTLATQRQMYFAWKIGQFVQKAAKHTPWDSSCLTQAMVAKFWCNLYKIPYVMHIGFAKSMDNTSYKGHAWLTVGSIIVTGDNPELDYKVVSTYSSKYIKGDDYC
jgi:hypothetical protein